MDRQRNIRRQISRAIAIALALAVLALMAWYLGRRLSPDALAMAIGLFFGILASVPAGLMAAAGRRDQERRHYRQPPPAPTPRPPADLCLQGGPDWPHVSDHQIIIVRPAQRPTAAQERRLEAEQW